MAWPHTTRSRPCRACSIPRRSHSSVVRCRHTCSAPGGAPTESKSWIAASGRSRARSGMQAVLPEPLAPVTKKTMRDPARSWCDRLTTSGTRDPLALSLSKGGRARLQVLAEVRHRRLRLHVEAALRRDLEDRSRGVGAERRGAGVLHPQLTRGHGHALGGVGAEVELAHVDDAHGGTPAVPLEPDALDLPLEVGVVLEHGR